MIHVLKPLHLAPVVAALMLGACSTPQPPAPPKTVAASTTTTTVMLAMVPGSQTDFKTNVGDTAHFDYDRFDLRDGDKLILQKRVVWLNKYPAMRVTLEGHTDERGTREYNLALGLRRANAVRSYLVELGLSAARIDTVSYGKDRPVCVVSAEPCWSLNRRAVTVLPVSPAS